VLAGVEVGGWVLAEARGFGLFVGGDVENLNITAVDPLSDPVPVMELGWLR